MTEIDIWIKVIEKLGFKFIDELTLPNTNEIKWCLDGNILTVYFNYRTGRVGGVYITTVGGNTTINLTKESFYGKNKDIFRDVKLESLFI